MGVLLVRIGILVFLLFFSSNTQATSAQEPTTRDEFWPEIDIYINLKPKVRLFLLGTVSKAVEDGELFNAQAFEAQIGAHIDYIPNKHLILRTGYRYGRSLEDDSYREHRLLTEQTLRKLLPGDFVLSDRNREDFRFLKGDFSFRYRNRLTIEREFELKKRTITPYVSGEVFYDTRYDTWNRNRLATGVQISLRRGRFEECCCPNARSFWIFTICGKTTAAQIPNTSMPSVRPWHSTFRRNENRS